MTEKLELYKCKVCTNVVEVTHRGVGTLVCCDEPMELLPTHTPDVQNAHFAHVEQLDDITKKVIIKHVMTPEHHIEFIEAISNDGKYIKRKYLSETEPAELVFKCNCKEGYYIRLYCNLDGVWETR